ncbi:MAG: ATP-dependent DNA helicase RecG [Streptosporangiaceae bacterium]
MTTLQEPLARVLGPKTGKALLESLSLHTVGDLIRHYPRRFYNRGELTDLSSLREGDHVTVLARVVSVAEMPLPAQPGKGRRSRLEVIVTDDRAKLVLTFFSGIHQYRRVLRPDVVGMFAGTVSSFRNRRQLVHPECEMLPGAPPNADLNPELAAEFATEMIPVYPASARVPSWRIAKSVKTVLDTLDVGADPLPAQVRERYELAGRAEAIRAVHRPLDPADRRRAIERLKWDEAFLLQAALAQRRLAAAAMPAMPRPRLDPATDGATGGGIAAEFDARLPFTLTAGQVAVGETIAAELACAYPMHRLLQGEVGSGKTVIAIRAMLQVVDAGGQAALLAPTEVLAQQHYRSVTDMLGPLARRGQLGGASHATGVALLTGSLGAAARRSALSDVFTGDAGIVIGTHALLEEQVQFADLGLVVIDEQHRFGVEQRDALRAKAADNRPHVLVMTATPIPRTVAMTVYGDLETSTLTELPAGRAPIASFVVPAADKPRFVERAWERVREEVGRGQQAYVVCPRIGGDEDPGEEAGEADVDVDLGPGHRVDLAGAFPRGVVDGRRQPLAVLDVAATLDAGPLAGLRLGILHGRLHPEEKDRVMREFSAGELDVLVATTVIEVGVDVPNATVMVVMDAERFGVSQLHQLRGRVGRGTVAGLCLLVSEAPPASPARERLEAVAATLDGFKLSRLDLEQRREGDVLGAAQAGRQSSLRLLRLLTDEDLIGRAREEASVVVSADPQLTAHPALRDAIEELLGVQAEYLDKT